MAGRAVLFDLDNTLHDRDAALVAFVQAQYRAFDLESLGFGIDRWTSRFVELDQKGKVWKDVVYGELREEFGLPQTVDRLLAHYEQEFFHYVQERHGALRTLKKLMESGWRVGVVTNGREAFQRKTISALGIAPLLDTVVISESCGLRKPDPRIFNLALDALDAEAADSWFVGDDPETDVEGARAAGMSALWFRAKGSVAPNLSCGEIDRLEQVVDLIQSK
jgi:putative hydrolase of the HAD superfamily